MKSSTLITDVTGRYFVASHDLFSDDELTFHIGKCVLNDRASQKIIYTSFYGYAMAICQRYSNGYDDSVEILNDGFLKIFQKIGYYKPACGDIKKSFKGWIRRIMIYTAIDHFRRNKKERLNVNLDDSTIQVSAEEEDALSRLSSHEIVESIQKLLPAYRTVLNLFVIDGFTHDEISKKLGISVGTSKFNLAKVRKQLQKILSEQNRIKLPGSSLKITPETEEECCGCECTDG
jgi:RNA polymerase sigma-70 factor (ECF subfamily)